MADGTLSAAHDEGSDHPGNSLARDGAGEQPHMPMIQLRIGFTL